MISFKYFTKFILKKINSPSDLACADIGPDALPVLAGAVVVLADGDGARVPEVAPIPLQRLPPTGQAMNLGIFVADVAMSFLICRKRIKLFQCVRLLYLRHRDGASHPRSLACKAQGRVSRCK